MTHRLFSRGGSDPGAPEAILDPEITAATIRVFALVGEAVAEATHALLAGDRDLAKRVVDHDVEIDRLVSDLIRTVEKILVDGTEPSREIRSRLHTLLRIMPEVERNGDMS